MSNSTYFRYQNFIESVTSYNDKLAHQIFNQHDSFLHASIQDPEILLMYNFFQPYKMTYSNAYIVANTLRGKGTSGTQSFIDLLNSLSSRRIRKWDIDVQQIYDQDTPAYRKLLPHRRKFFQNGSYENRINAVGTFLIAITNNPDLLDLEAEVSTFYNQLVMARDEQVGGFGAIDVAYTALEMARVAAAQAMFKNYASLLVKYYLTPQTVSNYMPTKLLQTKKQNIFTGHLAVKATHRIFKRKLNITNQELTLINNGDNALEFYFTEGLTELPNEQHLTQTMHAHSKKDISPEMAGYTDKARFLYVRNLGTGEGSWMVNVE